MNADQKKSSLNDEDRFSHHTGANFQIYPITGDGNCLFRAMAYIVFGRQSEHSFIRNKVVSYVSSHWKRFKNFFPDEDRLDYRDRMSSSRTFGSESEIVAFAEVFECKVHVYFKDSPERDPLMFGNSATDCFILYSGITDCGHYDVLLPLSRVTCSLTRHKESIRNLRRRTYEEFNADLNDFKLQEQDE
ncbi:OTU domain-containing protein [Caerostris extrusa]|uniref:OTU domain-containing protein n=1 Tax=Caerostris extrusa TaxID=172846 RepID=A0AAV4PSP8_CAEEX|nr:OTU domain-containing protein [Caerostris extrusa]